MALTVILICLAIQRWLQLDRYTRNTSWFTVYYHWLQKLFKHFSGWPSLLAVFALVLPGLILYVIASSLIYHLLGLIGYYLLVLVVLWYAMDARQIQATAVGSLQQYLLINYRNIFSYIFWLVVLGSFGVVLYALLMYLTRLLEKEPEDERIHILLSTTYQVVAVLDWLPLRLLGLTFALVGQFSSTLKTWYAHLIQGLRHDGEPMVSCANAALGDVNFVKDPEPATLLIIHALWIWLVSIALFTIGRWVG